MTPAPQKIKSPSFILLNEDISWTVYPIETIIAEKLHALIAHGDANSRSKDVYDLIIFLPKADPELLKKAIINCFKYRETNLPSNFANTLKSLETTRLERGWAAALASVPNAPKFKESFKNLIHLVEGLLK